MKNGSMRFCYFDLNNNFVETKMSLKEGANVDSYMESSVFSSAFDGSVVDMKNLREALKDDDNSNLAREVNSFLSNYNFTLESSLSFHEFNAVYKISNSPKFHDETFSEMAHSATSNSVVMLDADFTPNLLSSKKSISKFGIRR